MPKRNEETILINFRMPETLKARFDYLTDIKSVSRTSLLNRFVEEYCRFEEKEMIRDLENFERLKDAKSK